MRRTLERPTKITPDGDDGYFEEMTKAVFRAGFSWPVIREKWDGFVESMDKFNLSRVASYGPDDLERLFEDRSIVRNRRKIVATVENRPDDARLRRRARVVSRLLEDAGPPGLPHAG